MKVYRTTVQSKGSFKGWTSNLCSVTMGYKPDKDKYFFIKVWAQQSKEGQWLKQQIETIKQKVKWNYDKFVLKNDNIVKEKVLHTNNHHLEAKCERCIQLGNYCKNGHKKKLNRKYK